MSSPSDRRIGVAVVVSLVVHALLLWLLPRGTALVATLLPAPAAQAVEPVEQDEPIRFEFVDLPDQRAEAPSRPDAPGSDLSRRAHGGDGESSTKPGITGNTYQLQLAPGAPAPVPAPPTGQPEPRQPSETQRTPQQQRAETVPEDGSTTVVRPRVVEPEPAPPILRGLSPLAQPPNSGGAVPDREGGQVDLGPLSFDTQWYDWGPYAAEMLRRIRYHWRIPEIAQLGVQGVVRIRFLIEKNGRVSGLQIQSESGHPPMDFAARDAILKASPLPPLPSDLTGVEREGVTITFYYNVRPPDTGR